MIDADDILAECRRRGVKLRLDGTRIAYTAASGMMTRRLLDAIAEHKDELIARLEAGGIPDIPRADLQQGIYSGDPGDRRVLTQPVALEESSDVATYKSSLNIPYIPQEKITPRVIGSNTHARDGGGGGVCAELPIGNRISKRIGDIGDISVSRCNEKGSDDTPIGDIPRKIGDMPRATGHTDAYDHLRGPRRTRWGTICWSAPDAPEIEAFGPPPE